MDISRSQKKDDLGKKILSKMFVTDIMNAWDKNESILLQKFDSHFGMKIRRILI